MRSGKAGALTFTGNGNRRMRTMLRFWRLPAVAFASAVLVLAPGCKRGDPAKTLLLYDVSASLPRRFDDVKVLKKDAEYVKFKTASGEVIEFRGRYTIEN